MRCGVCDGDNEPGARFCGFCGSPLPDYPTDGPATTVLDHSPGNNGSRRPGHDDVVAGIVAQLLDLAAPGGGARRGRDAPKPGVHPSVPCSGPSGSVAGDTTVMVDDAWLAVQCWLNMGDREIIA